MNATKKLYRSNTNTVFAGVLGGIGEYYDIDPTILRLVYILITIASGFMPALIGYIIAALIMPKKPIFSHKEADYSEKPKEEPKKKESVKEEVKKEEEKIEEEKTEKMDI